MGAKQEHVRRMKKGCVSKQNYFWAENPLHSTPLSKYEPKILSFTSKEPIQISYLHQQRRHLSYTCI